MKFSDLVQSKKLLFLIHPDVIFETNFLSAQEYYKAIEDSLGSFDYTIVHLFYSEQVLQANLGWDASTKELYKNFLKMLKRYANVVLYDYQYSASFKDELPSYLIDHPGTTLYFAGGYENSCVKQTMEIMDYKLKDIIDETETKIVCYKPLIIKTRHEKWKHTY